MPLSAEYRQRHGVAFVKANPSFAPPRLAFRVGMTNREENPK